MRVCPQCGARYEDEAAFCPMDGSPLGELSSPSVSTLGSGPVFAPPSSASGSVARWQPTSRVGSGPHVQTSSSSSSWSTSGAALAVSTPGESAPSNQPDESLRESEEPLLGVILGDRYRVDERIGAGGMGLVYRATHVLIGRKLAVKLLRRRYATQPEVAERFVQEARIASSVKHPNVVDILDYGITPQGSPYYVMEFLAGHSLAREIVERGPLEPRRALGVAIAAARGLAAAHQAGIIHRDLKPDNVFVIPADLGAPEQVKILDFGIARVTSRKTRLTAAGSVVGTPEYMSPEQARGDDLDARSDIYALGIVLFELLTGRVPLSADSTVGTLTKQVFELPPPLREIDPRFAGYPSIEAALARLLAKNRDERPATALDAANLLATAAANDLEPVDDHREQAVLAGWSQPGWSQPGPEPDRPRRSTIMIGSGAITSAHRSVEAEGPRTGSFAAKQGDEAQLPKRPSVIVTDAPPSHGQFRPARVLQQIAPPPMPPPLPAEFEMSSTPTPAYGTPSLGKRSRGGLRRRHLPLILVGVGAAIFAALVTIGFVRWLQRREARGANTNITGMKGSPIEDRVAARVVDGDPDPGSPKPRTGVPNTNPSSPVEAAARETEHLPHLARPVAHRGAFPDARIQITRESRPDENAVR